MATITRKSGKSAAPNSAASTRARRKVTAPREFLLSADQYLKMADQGFFEGRRVELLEGKVIEMTPIGSEHAVAVLLAQKALEQIFHSGYHVRSQAPLAFEEFSMPEPDVAVVRGNIRDYAASHPTQAALVVEVSDATLRIDRTTKARLYAEAGIAEYWILNLRARQLEVHRAPQNDKYSEVRVLAESENVSPLAAPDATLLISDLLP